VNELYKENYKPLKKEIKEDYRRWKDLSYLCIRRINIVKMAILPKAIYMFNAMPIKIPMTFITEIEKSTLMFILKHKRLQIAKAILSKKEQCWRYHNTRLQTILQSNSSKNSMVLAQNRHEDQWNRIEDPDMNPHNYIHHRCFWEKWLPVCKKLKLDPCLSPCTSQLKMDQRPKFQT
jgi:hypothetical protein